GACAAAKSLRMVLTISAVFTSLRVEIVVATRILRAWPSCDVPCSHTKVTAGTVATVRSIWPIAASSAGVSGPSDREATMIAVAPTSLPWNGAASAAARWLGLLAERNWALFVWVTLDSDGRLRVASSGTTSQAARTSQRNLIDKRAMVSNIRSSDLL